MNLSDQGAAFIGSHEGLRLEPYNDPFHCTIGIGHLIHKGTCTSADFAQYKGFTEQQAFDLFRSDSRKAIDAVAAAVKVPLTQNQFDALCVDEDTEILTADGWARWDEIEVGTEVLTLNHNSGTSEWQPIQDLHVYPAKRREMVRLEGTRHSSLTTLNHRWPVQRGRLVRDDGKLRLARYDNVWTTSETFNSWDRLLLAAPPGDAPSAPKWHDDFVELVAWSWTEGSIRPNRGGVAIYQTVYPERIRQLCQRMIGPPSSFPHTGTGPRDTVPRWNEGRHGKHGKGYVFRLNWPASESAIEQMPNRVPSVQFIRSLTLAQRLLFLEVSHLADGRGGRGGTTGGRQLIQKYKAQADSFQIACVLSGFAASVRRRDNAWKVQQLYSQHFLPRRVAQRQLHEGLVWCPTTPNGTWMARRDGHVFYTGNCSFTFNVGTGAFRSSTLLKRLNAGDYQGAASEFGKWVKAGGKVLPGLVRRRKEEAALFLTPDAPGTPAPPPVAPKVQPALVRGPSSKFQRAEWLHPVFRVRLEALFDAVPFTVTSGGRSTARQAELYRAFKAGRGNPANPPGTSWHEYDPNSDDPWTLAQAADIEPAKGKTDADLHRAAKNYGLHFPIKGEPWHIQPLEAKSSKRTKGQGLGPVPTTEQPTEDEEEEMIKYGLITPQGGGPIFGVYVVPEEMELSDGRILQPGTLAKVGFTNGNVLEALIQAGYARQGQPLVQLSPEEWDRIPHVANV